MQSYISILHSLQGTLHLLQLIAEYTSDELPDKDSVMTHSPGDMFPGHAEDSEVIPRDDVMTVEVVNLHIHHQEQSQAAHEQNLQKHIAVTIV